MQLNPWKVMMNPVGDGYIWQVYRIKDKSQPMHAGNIETTGKIFDSEAEAQAEADRRNAKWMK